MCMQSVRNDSLGYEPIRVGAVFGPADLVLASPCHNGSKYATNVIEVGKFDELTYFDIVICLIVVMVVISSLLYLETLRTKVVRRQLRRIVKITMKCLWSFYETVVDQNSFKPSSWSARCLWLFFIMAFWTKVGVLLNLMSTNQVAEIQAPQINSLDDLLSSEFAHYQPVVLRFFYSYSLMLTVKPETKIGKLFIRIKQNITAGLITADGTDMLDFFKR